MGPGGNGQAIRPRAPVLSGLVVNPGLNFHQAQVEDHRTLQVLFRCTSAQDATESALEDRAVANGASSAGLSRWLR